MNLLITGAWQHAPERIEGHEIRFLQQESEKLPCDPEWVEGIVCNGLFLYHSIDLFKNLRYIQLTSAGFDRVPMERVRERGIVIHNARGVYSGPMAEYAITCVLDIYKGMSNFRDRQMKHEWVKNRGVRELAGQRVLIVGCGSVGTECAKRFKAFDCEVIGIDIAVNFDENYKSIKKFDCLDAELEAADIVVLTLPLTPETEGIINRERIDKIRGILVNISRGRIIDQRALEEWNGVMVLDVFEEEPLPKDSPLWDKPYSIITPHNSFIGDGNRKRLSDLIIANLIKAGGS